MDFVVRRPFKRQLFRFDTQLCKSRSVFWWATAFWSLQNGLMLCGETSHNTHRELRERRPWKASEANSDIWLLLKSLGIKEPRGNKTRQVGTEPKSESVREREKWNTEVHMSQKQERTETQRFGLWADSHPTQLLIRRKGPGWDHLDGVLLQSSGTKHKHTHTHRSLGRRPARKRPPVRHFDDRCQIYANRQTSKHTHTRSYPMGKKEGGK